MINIIIPLDFSQTSFNAAHYAANMYKGRADVTLILYHFYIHGEDTQMARNYLTSCRKNWAGWEVLLKLNLNQESGL